MKARNIIRFHNYATFHTILPNPFMTEAVIMVCKSMNWFLNDDGLRHERVNELDSINSKFSTLMSSSKPLLMQIKTLIITPISRTINFIKKTQRFEQALYWANKIHICDLTSWNRSSLLVKVSLPKYFSFPHF